jgi:hypothetical protein
MSFASQTLFLDSSVCVKGSQVHTNYNICIYFISFLWLFYSYINRTKKHSRLCIVSFHDFFILETFLLFLNKYYLCRIKHVTTKIGCSDCAPWSIRYSGKLF